MEQKHKCTHASPNIWRRTSSRAPSQFYPRSRAGWPRVRRSIRQSRRQPDTSCYSLQAKHRSTPIARKAFVSSTSIESVRTVSMRCLCKTVVRIKIRAKPGLLAHRKQRCRQRSQGNGSSICSRLSQVVRRCTRRCLSRTPAMMLCPDGDGFTRRHRPAPLIRG